MMNEIKDNIIKLLNSTGRDGIENLIEHMEQSGFFKSACSTNHHLSYEGGLAQHSYNVWCFGFDVMHICNLNVEGSSWILVSLLHDLGKMGQFGKEGYIINIVSDRKGGYIQSESKPYEINKDLLPVPHEIRSIQIASQFIELTEEESFAILHHNGMYGDLKYQLQGKETPLQLILHFADMWASRVIEKEEV